MTSLISCLWWNIKELKLKQMDKYVSNVIEQLKINMIRWLFQSNTHINSPGYSISSQVPSQSENCYLWCWFMLHWVRELINDLRKCARDWMSRFCRCSVSFKLLNVCHHWLHLWWVSMIGTARPTDAYFIKRCLYQPTFVSLIQMILVKEQLLKRGTQNPILAPGTR